MDHTEFTPSARLTRAIAQEVEAGAATEAVAAKHSLSVAVVESCVATLRCKDREVADFLLRKKEIERAPTIEAQTIGWIDLMAELDRKLGPDHSMPRTIHLEGGKAEVYCRWARHRKIDGRHVLSLDLAHIMLPKSWRRRGWLTAFINLLRRISPTDGILVEHAYSDINPWIHDTLTRWGFRELSEENYWLELRKVPFPNAPS